MLEGILAFANTINCTAATLTLMNLIFTDFKYFTFKYKYFNLQKNKK
jgi:hypothetical protein